MKVYFIIICLIFSSRLEAQEGFFLPQGVSTSSEAFGWGKTSSNSTWKSGFQGLLPVLGNQEKSGFRGRTSMLTGVAVSGGGGFFLTGLAHELTPNLTLFTQSLGGFGGIEAGTTEFGFNYTGFNLGQWSVDLTGSFSPNQAQFDSSSGLSSASGARQWLSGRPGHRFSTTFARDWGDVSTVFRISYNDAYSSYQHQDAFGTLSDPLGLGTLFPRDRH